jgi:uncharacterized repeat protein (TIGR03833 family)
VPTIFLIVAIKIKRVLCFVCFLINILGNLNMNRMFLMSEFKRSEIKTGMQVKVVLKEDQRTGNLTEGIVKDILTKSPKHPHGIKVRLESGEVGRVKEVVE